MRRDLEVPISCLHKFYVHTEAEFGQISLYANSFLLQIYFL